MTPVAILFYKEGNRVPALEFLDEIPMKASAKGQVKLGGYREKDIIGIGNFKKTQRKKARLRRYYEEEKLKDQIARQVRELRSQMGITQSDLAKLLGTSQSAVARLEDAEYEGNSIENLQKVAKALHCRVEIRFVQVA